LPSSSKKGVDGTPSRAMTVVAAASFDTHPNQHQNGFTITMITMMTMSTVGTSFAIR
jgi:hypothetical protein